MIINTELKDIKIDGKKSKRIIMSYIDHDGKVQFMTYDVPLSEMYSWKYTNEKDVEKDTMFISWDGKPVKKDYSSPYLNNQRIHEILVDLINKYPQLNSMFDLNQPDIAFSDIETQVDDDGFPKAEYALKRVNTISWVHGDDVIVFGLADLSRAEISNIQKRIDKHCERFDCKYKFEYRYYDSEAKMLYDYMLNYVRHIPCLCGWNFLGYDWKYLVNRCKRLGIDIDDVSPSRKWVPYSLVNMFNTPTTEKVDLPMHKFVYDYQEVYFKWDQAISPKEGYKLDQVADAALGVKKVEHALGFHDMWEKAKEDYVFYNAVDSILVREIDKKLKTAQTFYALANLIHCDVMTALSTVKPLEIVQTETIFGDGKIFPNIKKEVSDKDESYEGAFVYAPKPGFYRYVIALDFASLYPTTMRQFNISPDTFLFKNIAYKPQSDEIKTSSGAVYKRNVEGMLPKILTKYYKQRKVYKKEMQIAIQEKYDLMGILELRQKNSSMGRATEVPSEIKTGKFYTINPYTCSIEDLNGAIGVCFDKENVYAAMEQGCKRFINSVYGALGNRFYNCANLNIAESITLQGQDLIKTSVKYVNLLLTKLWPNENMREKHRMIALMLKEKYPEFDVDRFLKNCMNVPDLSPFDGTAQIYGDTDSGYITLLPLIQSCGLDDKYAIDFILGFNRYVLDEYMDTCMEYYAKSYNCPVNLEKFELEKIARSVLMLKKKKYVMDIAWKEPDVHLPPLHNLVYKGVEVVKGTSSLFCRTKQKDFVIYLMDHINSGKEFVYGDIVTKLKSYKREFAMQAPDDICETMSLADYEKYILNDQSDNGVAFRQNITVPMHARASSIYNNKLYTKAKKYRSKYAIIHEGDKIKMYYTVGCKDGEDVFAYLPGQYPKEFGPKIDIDKQFEKLILAPLNRYIEALGLPSVNESLTYSHQLY